MTAFHSGITPGIVSGINPSAGSLPVDQAAKVRELRSRRAAARQGLKLSRSRRRDPRALDYGLYWLIDVNGAYVTDPKGVSLDEVEAYLNR